MLQSVQSEMTVVSVDAFPTEWMRRIVQLGETEQYVQDEEFQSGWFDGYGWEDESGEFDDIEITLDVVLDLCERNLSMSRLAEMNRFSTFAGMESLTYARCVGFVFGWLRWMFDADRGPFVPFALLRDWSAVERLTVAVAAHVQARSALA